MYRSPPVSAEPLSPSSPEFKLEGFELNHQFAMTGGLYTKAVATDWDQDGNIDLFFINKQGSFDFWKGIPMGQFQFISSFTVRQQVTDILVQDINGDKQSDLLFYGASYNSPTQDEFTILLGDGKGGGIGATTTIVPSGILCLTVGDFNQDLKMDVIAYVSHNMTHPEGQLLLLPGKGDGTFDTPVALLGAEKWLYQLTIIDINHDGNLDLLAINYVQGSYHEEPHSRILFFAGKGDGTVLAPIVSVFPGYARQFSLGDINEDGFVDLLLDQKGAIALGSRDGSFHLDPIWQLPDQEFWNVDWLDLNGDGILDIVGITSETTRKEGSKYIEGYESLITWKGKKSGGFELLEKTNLPDRPGNFTIVDVNQDTKPDLVFIGNRYGINRTLLGNGDGTFQLDAGVEMIREVDVPVAIWGGRNELFLLGNNPEGEGVSSVAFHTNYGDGSPFRPFLVAPISSPFVMTEGDLNHDSQEDLIVLSQKKEEIRILLNEGSAWNFYEVPTILSTGKKPTTMVVSDVNKDNLNDILVTNQADHTVRVWLGNIGKYRGEFEAGIDYPTGQGPVSMVVADVNGDGALDIVTANILDQTISILQGNGKGEFATPSSFPIGGIPSALLAFDINQDGKKDLVVLDSTNNQVLLFFNEGKSQFSQPQPLDTFQEPIALHQVDFNQDGLLDLAVLDKKAQKVIVYLGKSTGGLDKKYEIATGQEAALMTSGFFNDDQFPDLALVHPNSGIISVFTSKESIVETK